MHNPSKTHNLFTDPLIDEIRGNGGQFETDGIIIRLPEIFGFCGGVQSAIRQMETLLASRPQGSVFLLGELIHNPTVNQRLTESGVRILDEQELPQIFELASENDTIVIPAFGVPLELENELRKKHPEGRILDTTCGYVKRVWHFVEASAREKRTVVIHGKPDHPETRSTVSRALTDNNAVVIVQSHADIEALARHIEARKMPEESPTLQIIQPRNFNPERMALANQTTMLFDETRKIEERLRKAVEKIGGDLEACSTVCRATQERQNAARKLCETKPDLVLVIGGFGSSNTTQLCRIAEDYAPTYFIGDARAFSGKIIHHFDVRKKKMTETRDWLPSPSATITLLAGASCPDSVVGQVVRRLVEL